MARTIAMCKHLRIWISRMWMGMGGLVVAAILMAICALYYLLTLFLWYLFPERATSITDIENTCVMEDKYSMQIKKKLLSINFSFSTILHVVLLYRLWKKDTFSLRSQFGVLQGSNNNNNKNYYSPERKNILNKQYVSWGSKHSLFLDFFCKTKKTICIENIHFLRALWKMHLLLQFHR